MLGLIAAALLVLVGMFLIKISTKSKTGFILLMALVLIVSFLMGVEIVGFVKGIVSTIFISLIILFLDEAGILA